MAASIAGCTGTREQTELLNRWSGGAGNWRHVASARAVGVRLYRDHFETACAAGNACFLALGLACAESLARCTPRNGAKLSANRRKSDIPRLP